MDVTVSQMKHEPRKVGTLNGEDVCEVWTKGGLVMIVSKAEGKKMKTLGVGPHRAVARYIAKEREGQALQWNELSKSERRVYFEAEILPEYRALTARFQRP